jgi:aminopeptidase N
MRRFAVALLASLVLVVPAARGDVGAPGLGDPYFPRAGNGGYDAQHYDLNLSYDRRSNRLAGVARIRARALTGLTRFGLDLKGMRVRRIEVDGRRATFHRAGAELRIVPRTALAAGQVFTVAVRYRGVPRTIAGSQIEFGEPYGFLHTPDGAFVAAEPNGAYTWFPCNDHPADKATFTFRITVPKGSRAVANGTLVSRSARHGRRTFVWREDAPMATYLATVDTGRWLIRHGRTKGGVPVTVAVDPKIAPHRARRTARFFLRTTARTVDYESTVFGPYPFSSTGAIADDARYHGDRLGFSLETQTRPVYSGLIDSITIAHEIAHQWFGDSVSVTRWSDIWLNEGFASFAEYLWLDHTHQLTAHQSFRADYAVPRRSPFWKVVVTDPKRDTMFDLAVYRRGAMTLQALREKIGDGPFFTILKTWTATHRHGNATTAEFIALAEQVSGRDLGPFFHAWLYTAHKPKTW